MTIGEVEKQLKEAALVALPLLIETFKTDERAGVRKLCDKYQKKLEKHQEAIALWEQKLAFDSVFAPAEGYFVGIDEVGRGPLAGPVVAAAVILPENAQLVGLRDSKKLSEIQREALYEQIKEQALAYGIGIVDADVIDEINILQATFQAMKKALDEIGLDYQVVGVDGDKVIPGVLVTQHAIIKGDDKSAAIAAASVLAKVTRDRMMKVYHQTYPMYDWESNKGYGSSKHYAGIEKAGITPLHRKTFLSSMKEFY